MKNQRVYLFISVLVLASLVCALPIPGIGSGGGREISDEKRQETFNEINSFFESLPGKDRAADAQELLKFLSGRPEFEATGIAPDGTVWSRFTDGRLLIFPETVTAPPEEINATGYEPDRNLFRSETEAGGKRVLSKVSENNTFEISGNLSTGPVTNFPANGSGDSAVPESNLAVVFIFPDNIACADQAGKWLDAKKYQTLKRSDPSVDALKLIRNVGVFYICTHGGLGITRYYDPDQGASTDEMLYDLMTTTKSSYKNDLKYEEDLSSNRLVYSRKKDDPNFYYSITIHFIRKYMTFSKNSLVIIDACGSYNYDMKYGFKDAGASTFGGWTQPSISARATRYLFDRLLGSNDFNGQNPPNRPFDFQTVWQTMLRRTFNYDVDDDDQETPRAVFLMENLQGDFGMLAPSIKNMEVNEADKELTLHGTFGSEEGTVTIGGQPVSLKGNWDSERLVVDLRPAKDAGGKGDVIVTVRDHESNKVPLTLWNVKFKYTEGPEDIVGGYHWLDLDIYWRADVHKYREKPDEEPLAQSTINLEPADDSSAKWSCKFDGSFGEIKFSTESGEGELPFTREAGKYGFSSTAKMEMNDWQIKDLQFIVNYDPETTCMIRTTGPGADFTSATGFVALPSALENVGDYPALEPLDFTLEYELVGENRDVLDLGSWPYLEWSDTEATSPPEYDDLEKLTPG